MNSWQKTYNNGVADAVRGIPSHSHDFPTWREKQHYLSGYLSVTVKQTEKENAQ